MYAHHGLQRVQRVFGGLLLVVDIGFGNDVVLLVSAHQVDVFLAVVVHRGFLSQLLVDSLGEGLAEVGHLLDERLQFLQFQAQEHGGRDGTHRHGGFGIVEQVGLAEILAVAQQGYAQFLAVGSLADDLGLTVGHDEELLLVLAFLYEELAYFHFLRLERAGQAVHYLVVELREQRDGLQALGRERGNTVEILNRQPLALAELYLCAVHTERAAADLHPRQQFQQ